MKMIPSRQLAARPGQVLSEVQQEGAVVITRDGVPCSIMIATSAATLVDDIQELVFARARKAAAAIRKQAARTGNARLSSAQINAEITAVRKARRRTPRRG